MREAQDIIRELYDRDYLVNPQINITVLEYAKVSVNVLGAVNQPGAVLIARTRASNSSTPSHTREVSTVSRTASIKLSRTDAASKTTTFTNQCRRHHQRSTSLDQWPLQRPM